MGAETLLCAGPDVGGWTWAGAGGGNGGAGGICGTEGNFGVGGNFGCQAGMGFGREGWSALEPYELADPPPDELSGLPVMPSELSS